MRAEFVRTVANAAGVATPREVKQVTSSQHEVHRAAAAMQTVPTPEQRQSAVSAVTQSGERVRSVQQAELQRRQQDAMRASAAIARQSMNETRDVVKVLAAINVPIRSGVAPARLGSFIDRFA